MYELEVELETLDHDAIEGARIRSHIRWFEEGERSTSYFLRMEKVRQSRIEFHSMLNDGVWRCSM